MKWTEIKKRVKVFDRWWPEWGPGFVIRKSKSRVTILFENMKILTYDKEHVKFLAKDKR